MKVYAIIPAAGSGSRFGADKNKLLENINGLPVIVHTLNTIASVDSITGIIVSSSLNLINEIKDLVNEYNIPKVKMIIPGGKVRQESVFLGLKALNDEAPDLVVIHDGARPLITPDIIADAIDTAIKKGSAVVAVPAKDTIKRVNPDNNQILETLNRSELWNIQTPQIFKYNDILKAHIQFEGQDFTDDSTLMEKLDIPVFVVNGSYKNIKITTREDIEIAKVLISS